MKASKQVYNQEFAVKFAFPVHFTRNLFALGNETLATVIHTSDGVAPKLLVFVEQEIVRVFPGLANQIMAYATAYGLQLVSMPLEMAGGEAIKVDRKGYELALEAIKNYKIDRHSYVMAIGGGAFLDAIGFAAATAHRGVRLIRVPTTVLAQADSGVGVKSAINYFGQKNWCGAFQPPAAVLNDFDFLDKLPLREWINGLSEAVKVALIRDAAFFWQIVADAAALRARDKRAMERTVVGSAEWHMKQIASGDPFEQGSARPLDFGHWAAHALEGMSKYRLRHGEAVAIGIVIDCLYAVREGRLAPADCEKVIDVLLALGFELWAPELAKRSKGQRVLIAGLNEFREHLGGRLTITLLAEIGRGVEVHHMDEGLIDQALNELETRFGGRDQSQLRTA